MNEEKKNIISSLYVVWMIWTALGILALQSVEFGLYSALCFINMLIWVNTVYYLIKSRSEPTTKNRLLLFFFGCMKFNMFLFMIGIGTKLDNPIISMSALAILPIFGGLYHAYKAKKRTLTRVNKYL